ncbi:MAG: B12-binding domain-containing radical SAM protein [Planctomycetes bacterium]|nr:B12-binding domain-containing radical SAM protein [Planctomycetota bacterium]
MKITFIMPNIGRQDHSLYVDEARMEPLSLGVLAGLTPPDVECVLYDDRVEEIPYGEQTDLVAISIEIYAARRSYEIAAEYRERGVPVILGGAHPTLFPDECKPHCDSVFLGDGEFRWAEAVEDARRGELKLVYHAPVGVAQPGGLLPRRDLFVGKGYLPITLMQFSRGCRFACEFCAVSAYFDKKHYIRETDEVLAEIESQKRKYVFFVDDNFLSDQKAAKQFLRELIPMKIKWVSQASLDMTNDLELMGLLAESGCIGNVVGFESISPESVKLMKKAPNLMAAGGWDRYQTQVEILRDHHMQTWATFTLGHDFDTVESIRETHEFAMRNKFCFAAYNILMPYPGTPLYDRLKKENRLLWDDKWWLHPDYRFNQAAFVPKNMTPDELTEAIWECRDAWNRPWSIFKRMWDFKTHMSSPSRLALYLAYNPLYAKESYKKQGMLFGRDRKVLQGRPLSELNETPDRLVQTTQ